MRAGLRVAPRQGVEAEPDPRAEQLVPRGVKVDLVDPVAEAIVRAQPGRVLVRLEPPADRPR